MSGSRRAPADARAAGGIPVLDLSRFDAAGVDSARLEEPGLERVGLEGRMAFLDALRAAAREVGFFYVTGHGIEAQFLRDLAGWARRFFALPEPDKLAIGMVNSPHFRGYTRVAAERTRGFEDWREQIDIGAERPALTPEAHAPPWTRLQGPKQWPHALPALRSAVLRWQVEAGGVLIRLLRALSLALGQPEAALEPIYRDDPHFLVKLIRYPGRDATAGDQGVGAHKDSGLLPLLLQDEQPGLQVATAAGWIDVPPRADTLVVNIGEILELASDGYLRATLHRVVTPPAGGERVSVAYFMGARLDAQVPRFALPPALAVHAHGPERDPENPLFRDVGENYLKGRLRSHPDVARRFYADLIEDRGVAEREGVRGA